MISLKQCFHIGLFLAVVTLSARAGSFNANFDSGTVPSGTTLYGNAVIETTGGVGGTGCLKLTKDIGGQSSSFVLDDLDAGAPICGFDVSYDVLLYSSATPADGMSLCYGPDLPNGTWGEEGTGSGLIFSFDTYDNGSETPLAPSIDVAIGGTKLATSKRTIATITTNAFVHVHIRVNADGSLNFDYRGHTLFTNYFIPQYQALVDAALPGRFGFGARTGGSSENAFVDNLQITTFLTPMVGISQQPFPQTAQQGDDVAFDVRVANTNGATYQWLSNSVPIVGATSQTLTIPSVQPAASGSKYKVTVAGPNNTVTSTEVTLTVTNMIVPATPQLSFNFDDGNVPAGTAVFGNAYVTANGGVGDAGALHLMDAINYQNGAIVIADPDAGAPVYGFAAHFKTLVGGGTTLPADGFAFAFGNDIPADPTSGAPKIEDGVGLGTNLLVTFDIYNNDTIVGVSNPTEDVPAPSIDVRFGGQVIATKQLPVSFMESGAQYGDTIIQLNNDGTLSVVYRGVLVFDHLLISAFSSISGGSFALAARTGGLNENFWVDNFELTTITTPATVRITTQPTSQTILVNHAVTNTVAVNDTAGVTYQWYRNGTTLISGATDSTYIIPSVTTGDNNAVFTVQATKSSITVTSAPATLTVANLTAPASPQFSFNFDEGLAPAGTGVYGNSSITANGGIGDSGVLHLTDAVNGENGAFVVSNLVFGGNLVSAISVSFDVREGGGSGTPADGFSFNWGTGLADGTIANAETGTGNGVSLCFRIYVGNGNADNPPSPYIGIKYNGAFIASTQIPAAELNTDVAGVPTYRTMLFRVDPDGKAYLAYGERVLYNGLQLPNFTYIPNSKFGIYGRTGGLNNNQWFDNVKIQATQGSLPMSIVTQPADALVLVGQTATFSVVLNNPANATYQWQRNGVNITGATLSSYTTPPTTLADSGALFRVTGSGASGSATSSNAVLTVVSPIAVSNPIKVYTFDDCQLPPDTIINGTTASAGYIACSGGVGDSGVLHMTDNVNSQNATFLMPDFNTNAPVKAIAVSMAVRIADGSGTPADGISFSWGSSNSIPDTINFGEGGAGDGVSVGLITYAGRSDGPSFNVWYNGTRLVNKIVPYSALYTGDLGTDPTNQYATLVFRVNENGTLDMQYKGNAIFNALPIPGYTAIVGGRFGIGSRTGGENESQWIDNIEIATTPGLVPVPLNLIVSGTSHKISWSGEGFKLQSTDKLSPPIQWNDVPGATSPYPLPLTGPAQYYRLAPAQ